jgi:hypothetical protein
VSAGTRGRAEAILVGVPITLADARARLAGVRADIEVLIARRADLAELRADITANRPSPHGRLADAKAWEAELFHELEQIAEVGATVKGFAPLLLDFPGERDGVPVLWCWSEGEDDIHWYHRDDCGFAGRRPA